MKTFSLRLLVLDTSRVIETEVRANTLVHATILAKIMFGVEEGKTRIMGRPREVEEEV